MIHSPLGSRYAIGGALGRSIKRAASGTNLKTNLSAYWTLDELSDGSAPVNRADSSGNSNTLSDLNTTASGTGIKSYCADFESSESAALDRESTASLLMSDIDFTIALWAKRESAATQYLIAKGKSTVAVSMMAYRAYALTGGTLYWQLSNGSAIAGTSAAVLTSLNTWYFIVLYHDSVNNKVGIVVNAGTPTTADYSAGCADAADFPQKIAGAPNALGSAAITFDGLIDEVGIWKRMLTTDEITWLYNAGAGRTYSEF